MTSIAERLRQGVDPDDIQETESSMDIGANEIERLRAEVKRLQAILENVALSIGADDSAEFRKLVGLPALTAGERR